MKWCTVIKQISFSTWAVRIALIGMATGALYAFLSWNMVVADEQDNLITIYAYSDMLASEDFDDFTAETGIEVRVRHFEAIEEVTTKLVFTHDGGIDIVAPTDAMVEILVQKQLLRPLDAKRLPSIAELNPALLGRFYDPQNVYTYPFSWSPVGIGYDTRVVQTPREEIGWDLIWGRPDKKGIRSPAQLYGKGVDKVCLGEDPFELFFLILIHLYGAVDAEITPTRQRRIESYLKRQKAWVECYTNNLRYFLASGVSPAVVIPGAYMIQCMHEYPWADFVVPSVGSIMYVGNLGIPVSSKKIDTAHRVIEYLLSQKGARAVYDAHAFIPANTKACDELPPEVLKHPHLYPRDVNKRNIMTSHNLIPLQQMEDMWHAIIV